MKTILVIFWVNYNELCALFSLYRDFAYFVVIFYTRLSTSWHWNISPSRSRSTSDRSGKDCCGQWFNGPPLRFLVVLVALGGVACKFHPLFIRTKLNFWISRYTRWSDFGINRSSRLPNLSSHSWTAYDGYEIFFLSFDKGKIKSFS